MKSIKKTFLNFEKILQSSVHELFSSNKEEAETWKAPGSAGRNSYIIAQPTSSLSSSSGHSCSWQQCPYCYSSLPGTRENKVEKLDQLVSSQDIRSSSKTTSIPVTSANSSVFLNFFGPFPIFLYLQICFYFRLGWVCCVLESSILFKQTIFLFL